MKKLFLSVALAFWSAGAVVAASPEQKMVGSIVDGHILPGFAALAEKTKALDAAAQAGCAADDPGLIAAYHNAFDAWIAVSHMRFGPTEQDNRGFALAYWPDPHASTPKSLSRMIKSSDPVIATPGGFATISVAGRGLYAMEFLLFDPRISAMGDADYRCSYVRALAGNIAVNADAINQDWLTRYAPDMRAPGPDGVYRTDKEALQELFKAFLTGLQLNADIRLGRPLGTFERPRPKRAEARRSGRSLRHVTLSMASLHGLASLLAATNADLSETLDLGFAKVDKRATRLVDDPVFAGVVTPQGRLKVESLKIAIDAIRQVSVDDLGPSLGVGAGFNSLDGD